MSYSACITMVPHTRAGLAAIDKLRGKGIHTTMRSRGCRAGGGTPAGMRARPWDQDLPRERATHFSVYQKQPGQYTPYQRGEYIGTEPNGKVRIRCLP